MTDIPYFKSVESRNVGKNEIMYGAWPFNDKTRNVVGRKVVVNGNIKTIKFMETMKREEVPETGTFVGFLFAAPGEVL